MNEKQPLLQKEGASECISTRMKIMIYILINCCAIHITGLAQPQYIFHYLKSLEESNDTDIKHSIYNKTNSHQNCSANSSTSDNTIQGSASVWTWYISLSEYGLALPVIFFIGPMADRIGRKPLLLWNTTVMFISFILKTLVVYKQMPLYYYLIASGVEGLSGTVYGFNLINHTILANTTTTGKDRSFMMTVYDALIGVGAVCSNIATGYIIELLGYTYVYIIATGMLFLIPIVIKTTLNDPWKPSGNKSTLTIAKLPGQTFSLCCNKQLINSKMFFFILYLLILSLGIFPYSSVSGIRTLYLIGPPFCWTSEHIGWFGAGSDFLKYIGGTGILKIIHVLCVRLKDEIIVVLGLVSSVASLVLLGFSNSDWMVYGGKYIYVY